jgi:hypothetical protein
VKVRISFGLATQTLCCHSEERCDSLQFPLEPLLLPNLGTRFLLGGRVVTPLESLYQLQCLNSNSLYNLEA